MFFGILGPTEVRGPDGTALAVGGPRVRALLAQLLLAPGRLVTAEALIDGLYGEEPPGGAANALQSQVSRLRRGLRAADGAGSLVESHPAGYRLAVDPEDVDAHRFERLVREGQEALTAGHHAGAAALLRSALELWRGPALADLRDSPFAGAPAAGLEELRVAAVADRIEAELALGEHHSLIPELQQLVTAHPLRERLRGQLMRALYGCGRQAEALGVYDEARRILAEELGADPSAELTAVQLAVLRAEPSLTPAPRSGTRPGLPAPLTSFVGREEELTRIADLLGAARLVTLTGPGGAGKTRLALEACGREQGDVCFVELAPLSGGSAVPQAVAAALGVRETVLPSAPEAGGRTVDLTTRLVAALSGRRTLLVLDNCEHLVSDVARLAHRLLAACPGLRVLATSREALGITGETLCPVPRLGLPPAGAPAAAVLDSPAVRLLADRAAAVRPGFRLDAAHAAEVLRICTALDGLPLAIELAAARLRALTVAEVAARLDDRFRLLSRGDRTAAPRHQTLRAVVEWSWELLSAAEQMLARRLTVFAGGLTLETAAAVCGLPGGEVEELLADLVDKSLVEQAGGRFRMLDTIRAFCAERLADAGEEEELRRAHADCFLGLAVAAEPRLRCSEQLEWLARLDAEHGNLQAALNWSVQAEPETALRLLAALSWYWWLRGLRREAAGPAAALLLSVGTEPPAGLEEEYALCLLASAGLGEAPRPVRERVATLLLERMDGPPRQPTTLVIWALSAGPPDVRDQPVRSAEHLFDLTDPWSRGLAGVGTGFPLLFGGDTEGAEPLFRQALTDFRSVGDRWGVINVLDQLAMVAGWRGEWDASLALMDEAVELSRQLGAVEDHADMLCRRAEALLRSGDHDAARTDFGRAAEAARRAGSASRQADARHGLGELARLGGDPQEARRLLEPALAACSEPGFGTAFVRSRLQAALGRVAEAEGDAAGARSRHAAALAAALEHPNLVLAAVAVEGMAGVALLEGDGERAAALLGAATVLRGAAVAGDPDVARVAAGAERLLGAEGFAAAYAGGAALDRAAALALAGPS
ncbi:BTAD domain-containing putative transcriptional regulator [Streptacidiphilus griseoplanus]|uniref:BTAD domain-containing putative transcriptional regulator n=1 Tax=Peterkaempfera griseoplana TaxID=66896 RepID=UPI0006E429FC|nr:BTAD domain-containing putative transcriptional regulator [Peterkaempfera griseoplana]